MESEVLYYFFKTSEQSYAIIILTFQRRNWVIGALSYFTRKKHQNRSAELYFKFHVLSNLPLISHPQLSLDNIQNKGTRLKNKDKGQFFCTLRFPPLSTSSLILTNNREPTYISEVGNCWIIHKTGGLLAQLNLGWIVFVALLRWRKIFSLCSKCGSNRGFIKEDAI